MKLSVVVPVFNGGENLRLCLKGLACSTRMPDEVIVVDDGSTDQSAQIARQFGARVITHLGAPNGPAIARNRGAAAAQGDVLVFIDADVVVHPTTIERFARKFEQNPDITALFGSYDANPPYRTLVSFYKNLLHHFVHQHGRQEASTFWSGNGAITRKVFAQMGGFSTKYARPSIEDIELGVRLRQAGYRVWLCPDIQVTHLKHWTLMSLLKTDIFDRAVPWVHLIFSTSQMPTDLNLDRRSRVSAAAAWLLVLLTGLGFLWPAGWVAALFVLVTLTALNFDLYLFFIRKGGFWFTLGAVALHLLYFLYSSLTFGVVSSWLVLVRASKKLGAFWIKHFIEESKIL